MKRPFRRYCSKHESFIFIIGFVVLNFMVFRSNLVGEISERRNAALAQNSQLAHAGESHNANFNMLSVRENSNLSDKVDLEHDLSNAGPDTLPDESVPDYIFPDNDIPEYVLNSTENEDFEPYEDWYEHTVTEIPGNTGPDNSQPDDIWYYEDLPNDTIIANYAPEIAEYYDANIPAPASVQDNFVTGLDNLMPNNVPSADLAGNMDMPYVPDNQVPINIPGNDSGFPPDFVDSPGNELSNNGAPLDENIPPGVQPQDPGAPVNIALNMPVPYQAAPDNSAPIDSVPGNAIPALVMTNDIVPRNVESNVNSVNIATPDNPMSGSVAGYAQNPEASQNIPPNNNVLLVQFNNPQIGAVPPNNMDTGVAPSNQIGVGAAPAYNALPPQPPLVASLESVQHNVFPPLPGDVGLGAVPPSENVGPNNIPAALNMPTNVAQGAVGNVIIASNNLAEGPAPGNLIPNVPGAIPVDSVMQQSNLPGGIAKPANAPEDVPAYFVDHAFHNEADESLGSLEIENVRPSTHSPATPFAAPVETPAPVDNPAPAISNVEFKPAPVGWDMLNAPVVAPQNPLPGPVVPSNIEPAKAPVPAAEGMNFKPPPMGWDLVQLVQNRPPATAMPPAGKQQPDVVKSQPVAKRVVPAPAAAQAIRKSTGMKTIVYWNSFFNADDFRFGFGHEIFSECKVSNCQTTKDQTMLDKADALVFHGPHIHKFPPHRLPNQIYVYVQQEPHYYLSEKAMPWYKNMFNVTMTHRPDSDLHIPIANILHDPKKAKPKGRMVNPRKKPKDVVFMANHCSTNSKREIYIKELKKYIKVDTYGKCGDKQCPHKDPEECLKDFEKEYKFYLSFEKNYCTDYASPHVYRPLEYDIIPVVFGGADYSKAVPPHSVINVVDYKSPKDLADYLKSIGNNINGYSAYFAWKNKGYKVGMLHKKIMTKAFCGLCEMLHDPNHKYKDYSDIKSWWVNGMCDDFFMGKLRRQQDW